MTLPGLAKSSQALSFTKSNTGKLTAAYQNGTAANPRSTVTVNLRNAKTRVNAFTSGGAFASLNPGMALRNENPFLSKPDNSAIRTGLNQNRGFDIAYMKDMQKAWMQSQKYHNCNNGMSSMEKWAVGMAAVSQLAKLTETLVASNKNTKTTSTNNNTFEAKSDAMMSKTGSTKLSETANNTLKGMTQAKDSSTLRGAIEAAESQKTEMQANLTTIESELPGLKEAAEKVKTDLEKKNTEIKEKESEVSELSKDVKTKEKNLEASENNLKNKDLAFNQACANLDKANKSLGRAEANLKNAEMNKDENGKPIEPAYSDAKEAVAKAKQAVIDAEKAKTNAAGELEQAKADNNTAKQWYLESKQNYEEASAKLNTAKQELQKLKEEQAPMQETVDKYEKALNTQKELKSDIEAIEKEIPTQQARLTELEKKEESEFDNAQNTILKMTDKMSGKDGVAGTSDDKKLGTFNQQKYDKAINTRRNVNYTKLAKTQGEQINGQTFRTASYDGETLYMIGHKPVTSEEYNQALIKARGSVKSDPNA